jgi:hypothetical protein
MRTMRIVRSVGSLLFVLGMLAIPAALSAQVRVGVAITIAPPELPVYEQPICPGDGYLWAPGYWAYGDDDYYWVPGTWVLAPEVGFLWTPGYWGWGDGGFVFYDGYWGPQVGFYGGINYGFGYFGHGFEGGRWDNGHFFYNRAVLNVNVEVIHNVYDTRVNETVVNRVSFHGGNGGINERPTAREEAAAHERHLPPVAAQTKHIQAARSNPELRASANHGKPAIAATAKPGEFNGGGVVAAREAGAVHARAGNDAAHPNPAIHPKDLPSAERPSAPNTGNPNLDKKYQQQQEKLQAKQDQERQKLQQKQDQQHQRLEQQKGNDAKKQHVEQQHQQQTQQLQQRHVQQQQRLQQRQQPAPHPAPAKPHQP